MAKESPKKSTDDSRFHYLRAEMWKTACDTSLQGKEMVQQILDLVGPELKVSRACLNECGQRRVVCTVEWCDMGVKPSLGSTLSRRVLDVLIPQSPTEFSKESAKARMPRGLRTVGSRLIDAMVKALRLRSVLTVPLYADGSLELLLTFDICADNSKAVPWTSGRKRLAAASMEVIAQGLEIRKEHDVHRKARRAAEKQVRAQASVLDAASDQIEKHARQKERATAKLETSLRDKDVLLMEIQHRVKNNLQIIDSLMNLQAGYVKNEQVRRILQETRNRVRSMALIHEKLYQTGNLARIDLRDYLQGLVTYLFRSYGVDTASIEMRFDVQLIRLDPNHAILCGLIVNELVSNCLKHAFPDDRSGWIAVRFRRVKRSNYALTVSDNGVGLGSKPTSPRGKSLGLEMVEMLTDQLGARLQVRQRKGTEYRITFGTRQ